MPDVLPNFELKDREGTTTLFVASATVTPTDYPAVAGTCIVEFYIDNMDEDESLEVSWDGGTSYKTIKAGCFLGWSLKGAITQLKIRRAGTVDVPFELILNRDLD